MKRIIIKKDSRIDSQVIPGVLLFLYLTIPFFRSGLSAVTSRLFPSSFLTWFLCLAILFGYVILCCKKRTILVFDFWILFILICLFFALTVLFHPENEEWYFREDYGMIDYVLRPDNGVFIYLFLRLLNNPRKIIKTIKIAGWPMYIYFGRQVLQAMARGYWINTSNRGYEIHMSYNLSLGYNVLLFALAFLFCAFEEKKLSDWVGFLVGITLILTAGSRGPLLDIVIFVILYFLAKLSNSRRKMWLIIGAISLGAAIYILYPIILISISALFERLNISSRFIQMLTSGAIAEDSGRLKIWSITLQMIKDKPFGYGAFGTRPVISPIVYAGHPHQFFLEILVDFGVFVGGFIISWLIYHCIKIYKMKDIDEWKGVFLVFFGRACQLLLSVTFWHSIGLWGVIAIGVCMYHSKRRGLMNV